MAEEVRIQELEIEEIRPYENNARRNEKAVNAVAESIKKFGFKNPVIVDKEKVIISGHTRYKAAQLLGLKKIPVIVTDDMSEEKVRAFRLADNRVAEVATWDTEKLKKELADIDEDMTVFGFKKDDEVLQKELSEFKHKCPKCGYQW